MPRISLRTVPSLASDLLTIEMHIKIRVPAKIVTGNDSQINEKISSNAKIVGDQTAEAFKAELMQLVSK